MNIFKAVLEFWKIAHPDKIKKEPGFPDYDTRKLNIGLIREEVRELEVACEEQDLVEVADALGDILYVVVGMGITHGIPLEKVFAEVQRTNMAKFPDGKVLRRPSDGKIMKPEGWEPPDIAAILAEAGRED